MLECWGFGGGGKTVEHTLSVQPQLGGEEDAPCVDVRVWAVCMWLGYTLSGIGEKGGGLPRSTRLALQKWPIIFGAGVIRSRAEWIGEIMSCVGDGSGCGRRGCSGGEQAAGNLGGGGGSAARTVAEAAAPAHTDVSIARNTFPCLVAASCSRCLTGVSARPRRHVAPLIDH